MYGSNIKKTLTDQPVDQNTDPLGLEQPQESTTGQAYFNPIRTAYFSDLNFKNEFLYSMAINGRNVETDNILKGVFPHFQEDPTQLDNFWNGDIEQVSAPQGKLSVADYHSINKFVNTTFPDVGLNDLGTWSKDNPEYTKRLQNSQDSPDRQIFLKTFHPDISPEDLKTALTPEPKLDISFASPEQIKDSEHIPYTDAAHAYMQLANKPADQLTPDDLTTKQMLKDYLSGQSQQVTQTKTGIRNYDTFKADFYRANGWNDYGVHADDPDMILRLRSQGMAITPQLLDEIKQQEQTTQQAYIKEYGLGTYAQSGASGAVKFVLPATGKLIDPERPDINATDVLFDVATVLPGVGYISKAGNLIKNAVLAGKLVTIADTTSAGLFTVAQGMQLNQDWDNMTPAQRTGMATMTGITALGAGVGVKSLLTPEVRQSIGNMAKNIGSETKNFVMTDQPGRLVLGGTEDEFRDLVKNMSPEERQVVSQEIQQNIEKLSNKSLGGDAESLNDILRSDPVYNKTITIGTIAKTGQKRTMTLGDYLYWRYAKNGEMPETFSKSEANILTGNQPDNVWPDHMLNDKGRVKREYIIDQISSETGMEDMDATIEHLNDMFSKRKELESLGGASVQDLSEELDGYIKQQDILKEQDPQMSPSTSVQTDLFGNPAQSKMLEESNTAAGQGGVKENLIDANTQTGDPEYITKGGVYKKPLEGQTPLLGEGEPPKPPEPPSTSLASLPEPEGEPSSTGKEMTRTERHELYKYTADLLAGDDITIQRQAAEEFRRQEKAARFSEYLRLVDEYKSQGKTSQEAMEIATKEAMSGEYSDVTADYFGELTKRITNALYDRVLEVFPTDAAKQLSARTALTNMLAGKSMPNIPGIKGGSALTILKELFGDQPKLFNALKKGAEEGKPFRDVVEGKFYETGKDPVPVDQDIAEYLRNLNNIPSGKVSLFDDVPNNVQKFWRSGGSDIPITITGEAGTRDGVKYYNIEGSSTAIPETEIISKAKSLGDGKTSAARATDLQSFATEITPDKPYIEWVDMGKDQPALIPYSEPLIPGEKQTPIRWRANLARKSEAEREIEKQLLAIEITPSSDPLDFIENPADKKILQNELPADVLQKIPKPQMEIIYKTLKDIGLTIVDIGNFIRANKASGDMSFWRQQAPLIAANIREFIPANISAWKAVLKQVSAEASWERIKASPEYPFYSAVIEKYKKGDFLRPLHLEKGAEVSRGVEEFGYTQGVDRPIPKLTEKIPWVKLSERGFITGTNEHNWLIFQKYFKQLKTEQEMIAAGLIKLKPGETFNLEKELSKIMEGLSNLTGRGYVGHTGNVAPIANSLFFSLRLNLGRLFSVANLFSSNRHLSKMAWKNAVAFVGTTTAVLLTGERLGLWEIEKSPNNADFMRIRIGNTRIDPWGAYQSMVVLMARIMSHKGESSISGQEYDSDFVTTVANFIRGKLSPLAGSVTDYMTGTDFTGEKINPKDIGQWVNRIAPMAWIDIQEAFADNFGTGAATAIPTMLGAGVQTYTADWKDSDQRLGLPKFEDNLSYGITEPVYDVKDRFNEVATQIRGVDPKELTAKKDFSPGIQSVAHALLIQDKTKDLPSKKLLGLNADVTKNGGKTYATYYQMWQDRQKIVASGDKDKLKAFDNDERTRDARLGNMTQIQFSLLNQYHSLTSDFKRKEFLKKYPELDVEPREQYLRDNPAENALLAVHGQADVYTQKAYDEAQRLVKELDIPDNAVADYLPPKEVAEPYFKYKEAVSKYGVNSSEAMLQRANNPALGDWLKLEPVTTPKQVLEINAKNRDLNDKVKEINDLPSIPNKKAINYRDGREYAKQQFLKTTEGEAWAEDQDKITIINKMPDDMAKQLDQTDSGNPDDIPQQIVDGWVKYKKFQRQYQDDSAESKLYLLDNPDVMKYAKEYGLIDEKTGQDWVIPALQIDVKNRVLNAEYDKLYTTVDKNRFATLHPEWKADQYRKDAYERQFKYDGSIVDQTIVEKWVKYNSIPVSSTTQSLFGAKTNNRTLYRRLNRDFEKWGETVLGWTPITNGTSLKTMVGIR